MIHRVDMIMSDQSHTSGQNADNNISSNHCQGHQLMQTLSLSGVISHVNILVKICRHLRHCIFLHFVIFYLLLQTLPKGCCSGR